MEKKGVEALILARTELPLVIKEKDTGLKLYDTLKIHVDAAVEYAFSNEE